MATLNVSKPFAQHDLPWCVGDMQASLYEMTNYSADSAERMADLRGSIKLICSSIALELSEEDMDSLTQGKIAR